MTTTHTNIALVEGEVIVLGKMASGKIGDTIYCTIDKKICKLLATYASYSCPILASTAKEAEFTKDDIASAILFGVNLVKYGTGITEDIIDMEYEGFINELRPLSKPASITTDENFNVINVEWGQ